MYNQAGVERDFIYEWKSCLKSSLEYHIPEIEVQRNLIRVKLKIFFCIEYLDNFLAHYSYNFSYILSKNLRILKDVYFFSTFNISKYIYF